MTLTIPIFDNAYNGFNRTADFSKGKVVAINNTTMTAALVQAYGNPHPLGLADPSGGLLSANQGNMQYPPNGNVFLGWGSNAFVSESMADGTPVFSAYFATTGALHYRAYKYNFTSNPSDAPALWIYAHNTSVPTACYASWNGATEVESWNCYGGSSAKSLAKLGNAAKKGFETITTQPSYYAFAMTEAVARNGTALRNSSVIKAFVPGPAPASVCTEIQCPLIAKLIQRVVLISVNNRPTGTFSSPTTPQMVTEISTTPTSGSPTIAWSWSLYGIVGIATVWLVR